MNKSYKSETKKGLIGLGAMVLLGAVVISAADPAYQALSKIGRKKGTESIYQPGTYEASTRGFGGDVSVVLTVSDKDIETLTITGDKETPEIGGKAIAELPLAILKNQTAEVDSVAGATITSDAVKKAVNMALAEARGEELVEETKPAEAGSKAAYTPGTYEGSAQGFGGKVSVVVTVGDDGAITEVKVTGDDETPELGGRAIEELPAAIVEKQSADVDGIAAATITSDAIKEAVKTALAGAGGSEEGETAKEAGEASAVSYKPGTYEGSAQGFGGKVSVVVTVADDGAIAEVKVTGDDETPELGGRAIEELPAAIVEKQSADVDGIAAATITSDAIKEAVKAALEGAVQEGASEEAEAANVSYVPGTYEATEQGFGGDVKVTVTVTENGIESVTAVGDDETEGLGSRAIDELPAAIVEKQSADVDGIASATITSDALKKAVKTALEEAIVK